MAIIIKVLREQALSVSRRRIGSVTTTGFSSAVVWLCSRYREVIKGHIRRLVKLGGNVYTHTIVAICLWCERVSFLGPICQLGSTSLTEGYRASSLRLFGAHFHSNIVIKWSRYTSRHLEPEADGVGYTPLSDNILEKTQPLRPIAVVLSVPKT